MSNAPTAHDNQHTLQGAMLWVGAIVLALANFLAVLNMTIANVTVPNMAGALGAGSSQGTWVITAYAVAEAITVPLTGWLSARFGAVKVFSLSVVMFGVFSFMCGMSTSLDMLLAMRVFQGMAGGPLLALDVCQKAAPAIAQEVGARAGATIWRTSLKARNPRGTPDAWERTVLQRFAARRAAGEDPATIETSAQTATGFRYMKAIPMAEPCAQCHGTNVAPEVAAKIAVLYPQDKATGFVPGELRGAVSITWPAQH